MKVRVALFYNGRSRTHASTTAITVEERHRFVASLALAAAAELHVGDVSVVNLSLFLVTSTNGSPIISDSPPTKDELQAAVSGPELSPFSLPSDPATGIVDGIWLALRTGHETDELASNETTEFDQIKAATQRLSATLDRELHARRLSSAI